MNLFVYCFSCLLIFHLTTSSDPCGAVRIKYSDMNLGERNDVPYAFQSGKDLIRNRLDQEILVPDWLITSHVA